MQSVSRFFFFLRVLVQLFCCRILKRLSFLHLINFAPFSEIIDYISVGYFWALYVPLIHVYFSPISCCLFAVALQKMLMLGNASILFCFSVLCWLIEGFFFFPYKIQSQFVSIYQIACWEYFRVFYSLYFQKTRGFPHIEI